MAFRTNKTPVLQEKSASGSVATFNTALAMPLASCNIAVNAWQEGSGDPSPSNVRDIHGFSELNVMANNVVYTIQLGQEVYGAEVDVVNGVAHVTHSIIDMGTIYWIYKTEYTNPYFQRDIPGRKNGTAITIPIYKYVGFKGATSAGTMSNYNCAVHQTSNPIYIRDDRYTSADDFKTAMAGVPLMYKLAEPFDIQLTPTQIETLIGNNTIFADTGYVDLTFKDLDIAKRGNFREVFKLPLKKEALND